MTSCKVKVEGFYSQLKIHITKKVTGFNFGRTKDLSTLTSDIHLGYPASMNITFSDN